ncbi:hypothetical protein ACFOW4_15580 [Micromonospora sp. GCM10011542]|uniref:hypothetical protein n=1 Tax=Micromonospora sp. GCM10011542 TaxID=3317337 RepID=UPI00362215E8
MTAASIAGSGSQPPGPGASGAVEVVNLEGLPEIEFGDTEGELTQRGALRTDVTLCGPTLTDHDEVSPVFVEERLVLLWAGDPMRTPEGVTVGTPVAEVWSRYPSVRHLHAPRGTYRLDGLLASQGDRAYLFLHDGETVRKVIAGYADWAERLFDEGQGPC